MNGLAIIKEFYNREANRLKQEITIDRRSLLAFLLYRAEGNIGQLKRDLRVESVRKLSLHYQTSDTSEKLAITEDDLPLIVQRGCYVS